MDILTLKVNSVGSPVGGTLFSGGGVGTAGYSTDPTSSITQNINDSLSFVVFKVSDFANYTEDSLRNHRARVLVNFDVKTSVITPLTVSAYAGPEGTGVQSFVATPNTTNAQGAYNNLNYYKDTSLGSLQLNHNTLHGTVDITSQVLAVLDDIESGNNTYNGNVVVFFAPNREGETVSTNVTNVTLSVNGVVPYADAAVNLGYIVGVQNNIFGNVELNSPLPSLTSDSDTITVPVTSSTTTVDLDSSTVSQATSKYEILQSSASAGTLSGPGLKVDPVVAFQDNTKVGYTFSGTTAQAEAILKGLTFTPSAAGGGVSFTIEQEVTPGQPTVLGVIRPYAALGGAAIGDASNPQYADVGTGGVIDNLTIGTSYHASDRQVEGGVLNIRDGGHATNTKSYGGTVNVFSGGVETGGYFSFAFNNDGVQEYVHSIETIYSGGRSESATIREASQQIVMSGGVATDTAIQTSTFPGGSSQIVQAGGSAIRTTLYDDAVQTVAGSASGAVVNAGGTQTVASGGVADATSLSKSGAHLVLSDGATATNVSAVAGSTVASSGATKIGGLVGAGTVTIASGALNLYGTGNFSGGLSIASGALLVGGGAAGTMTLSGVVSGAGGVVKQGAGTLTLSAANTFTGGVSVQSGLLVATQEGALGLISGGLTLAGGTLETTVDMNMVRAIKLNATSTWLVDAGATTTLHGALSGAGGLVKAGGGVLALSGSNTATGGVTVKEGAVAVSLDSALGPASTTLTLLGGALEATQSFASARKITTTGGAVQVDSSVSLALSGVIDGSGLSKTGAGTLTLTGTNTYKGGTTFGAGVLAVGSDAALGDAKGELDFTGGALRATGSFTAQRNVKLISNAVVEVGSGASVTLTGAISGDGSLTKTGTGVLALALPTGSNSYKGGTVLAAGTLVVSKDAVLGSGALTFTGGTLETAGAVAASRAVHMQAGGTLQVDAGVASAFSGVIDGVGSLAKTGDGALLLSGANTFTGGLVLKGGVLELANAAAAGAGTIAFGSGVGTLKVDGVAGLANTITGFGLDDALDLSGLHYTAGATATLANGVLTVTSGGATETFGHFSLASGLTPGQGGLGFVVGSDGAGGSTLILSAGVMSLPGSGYTAAPPPPVLDSGPTASVAENTTSAAVVYTVHATSPSGALSYSISGDDADKFVINATTGQVRFQSTFTSDFEQPGAADGTNTYHLVVSATTDIGGRASQALAISVTDVNDNAPIVISDTAVSVGSGVAAGAAIYTVAATDVDTVNGAFSYALSGVDAASFNLDAVTGALSFKGAPVAGHVYDIAVQAGDGLNFSAPRAVEITVAAAISSNLSAPVFTSGVTATTPENVAAAVYTATAVDGDGDSVSFALTGADAALFSINPATGEVAFRTAPDFERPGAADGSNTYSFNVTASDGLAAHQTTQAVVLTVVDANDVAPVITSGATVSVFSGAAAGSAIYLATASDADTVNGARSYSLGGADAARFDLNAATGALSFKSAPSYAAPDDAGADHVYDVIVTASDGVNTSAAKAVAITVLDAAANQAPVFTSAATVTTPEEASPTTTVYTAQASDADGDTLVYALAGGADVAKFAIDAATGAVTFLSPPDFETPGAADGSNTYKLVVSASDRLHTVTQAVAIGVTDVADVSLPANPTETQAEAVINDPSTGLVKGDVAVTGTLDFTRNTGPLVFAGVISGSGSVEKTGGGTLTLSGVNTYSGPTNVDGGVLKVNGSIANSSVTVGTGAELGGSGTTGSVTLGAGASIGPGNSPGTLNTLGDLTLAAGATYKEEVGGYGAGQFDLITVTGAVKLNGATLNATLYGGFAAATASAPLVIIDNDGSDPVVGTFAGLAEGATVSVGGRSATISYLGGTGNDVTLSFAAPAGAGGGTTAPPTTPTSPVPTQGQQASFTAQFANLLRSTASSADALNPSSPIYAQFQASAAIGAQYAAGTISQAAAQSALNHLVDGTISVATLSYAFFTGKTPTSDGLDYLVHSASNPNDLNDPYYLKFNTENRYINFGAALAKGGAGTAAFHAAYDGLSFSDAFAKAYTTIFGAAPAAGKVDAILNALVPDGLGGQETRAQYFAQYGGDGPNGSGTKGAAIGFLLADAIKEGLGPYQAADQKFLTDLGAGSGQFNVDLVGTYGTPAAPSGLSNADAGHLH